MDADLKRRQKKGLSKRMKAEAESRRCPSCGRKAALSRHQDADFVVRVCRYCDYEKGGYVT